MKTLFLTLSMRLALVCVGFVIQGLIAPQLAHAQQPADSSRLDKLQAGFYRMKVGAIDVVALSDGTITFNVLEVLSRPKEAEKVMAKAGIKSPVEASMNVFWISLGQREILVDTGAGELMGPKLNKLTVSMKAAGISPEQITDILITHIHPDHSGGLSVGGRRVFPNAIVRVDKRELAFWADKSTGEKLPEPSKTFFKQVEQTVGPYIAAGKVEAFDAATQPRLFPELRAIPGYGHTPGQAYYVIESQGQKLVFLGDTLHAPDVQFEMPSITVKFDVDQEAAAATRRRIFDDAAKNGYLIAFAHMHFPGTGRVRKEGNHYRWYAVPYTNDATRY
jgi:glyoxylase-like metal-dependent hydrolase (beta-lactamase superfamily II)